MITTLDMPAGRVDITSMSPLMLAMINHEPARDNNTQPFDDALL